MRNNLILIPAILLVIAVAPLPYGYYTFLRIAVTISAALLAWQSYSEKEVIDGWTVVFGVIVVLFNPIIPVYLTREIWLFIDLGAAAVFAGKWYADKKEL